MTYRRILCPIDLSPFSQQAINVASSMAKSEGATLCFLFVAMPPLPASAGMAIAEVNSSIAEQKKLFEEIRPSREGVTFEHHLERGEPIHVIVDFIKDHAIDLVIMPTHGRSGLLRLVMGSVAEHVVRKATCPVLIVKSPEA